MTRGDLTDTEWELIKPHLPLGAFGPIPDLRSYFNAIMWRFRTGSPWRDVPERYGSWSTIYDRFAMWTKKNVFAQLMDTLIAHAAAQGQVDLSLVSVDSTVARCCPALVLRMMPSFVLSLIGVWEGPACSWLAGPWSVG